MVIKNERGQTLSNVKAPRESIHGCGQQAVYVIDNNTTSFEALTEMACPYCGVINEIEAVPAKLPHWRALRCKVCNRHIKFVSKYTPQQRAAHRQAGIREWMAIQPPTQKQLQCLRRMTYKGQPPTNRLKAYELIDTMRRQRGWV